MKSTIHLFCLCLISQLVLSQTPEINWYYDTDDICYGSAATADIDEDGKLEIVFSCYRRDSSVYALNAEDGSLLWKRNLAQLPFQGCNDVAPIIFDVNQDGHLEVIVPGSCNPTTFCLDGRNGDIVWTTEVHGSDSPPTIGDIDDDGKPEIIHGGFGGYLTAINGEDGSILWDEQLEPNGTINGEPILLDADDDGDLEIITTSWNFGVPSNIKCYNAKDLQLQWCYEGGVDPMYHGPSFADIDGDGMYEIVVSSQDGLLRAINAEDGSLLWDHRYGSFFHNALYATSMADVNDDGKYEIAFFDYGIAGLISYDGQVIWQHDIGLIEVFRGAVFADVTGDGRLDVIASGGDFLIVWDGATGQEHWRLNLAEHDGRDNFHLDHGPIVADFDGDGDIDIFTGGGYGISDPTIEGNFGRVYSISTNSSGGPDWTMFRRDKERSGTLPISVDTETKEEEIFELVVYPNPASDMINVRTSAVVKHINLITLEGKIILSQANSNRMDVGHIPAGVYGLEVISDDRKEFEKVVIVR